MAWLRRVALLHPLNYLIQGWILLIAMKLVNKGSPFYSVPGLCHRFATRGHWINVRPCWRAGEGVLLGGSISPHHCLLPFTKSWKVWELVCRVPSYTGGGCHLRLTFLDGFHLFGILSSYIWGAFLILQGMITGKSVLFCIVQSSMCLFMMGSLLGSSFKSNCERNQTGKGGTMISVRSIRGNAQTQ